MRFESRMQHLEGGLVVAQVLPQADGSMATPYLRQESHFMAEMQAGFYMGELGLERLDKDPFPNPDNPVEQQMRASYMTDLEQLNTTGLARYGIFETDMAGEVSEADSALVAMLVLSKVKDEHGLRQLCHPPQHADTEIVEWNTRLSRRGTGLGRQLLAFGAQDIHPEDGVVLDVAQHNLAAQDTYHRLGFQLTGETFEHGIFATTHLEMSIAARALHHKLGIKA